MLQRRKRHGALPWLEGRCRANRDDTSHIGQPPEGAADRARWSGRPEQVITQRRQADIEPGRQLTWDAALADGPLAGPALCEGPILSRSAATLSCYQIVTRRPVPA